MAAAPYLERGSDEADLQARNGGGREVPRLGLDLVHRLQNRPGLDKDVDAVTPTPSTPTPTLVPDVSLPPAEALPVVSMESTAAEVRRDVVRRIICSWEWVCATALAVFLDCENKDADPYRISATGDYGITQINAATWAWWLNERGFDFWNEWHIADRNVAMAHTIWLHSWWWPWSCF